MAEFYIRLFAFAVFLLLAAVGVMGLIAADAHQKGLICPFAGVCVLGLVYLTIGAVRQILSAEPPAADDSDLSRRETGADG